MFNQVVNLKKSMKSTKNNVEFLKKTCGSKISDFFTNNRNIAPYSAILKIAQYFFTIPRHNANCERIFSLINMQWSDKKNKIKLDTVKNIVTVKFHFKEFLRSRFHRYLEKNKELLRMIRKAVKLVL